MDSEVDVARLRRRVLAYVEDGRWHQPQDIATSLDAPRTAVIDIIEHAIANGRPRVRAQWERRKGGAYRLLSSTEKTVSLGVLIEELTPIIQDLREQGKKRLETISIGNVAGAAAKLQKLLNDWAE